ncbi:response regulator [Paenibacillus sp. TRM 82003]|nr:response regulator [Paenibacillus sp. TRM 82003]
MRLKLLLVDDELPILTNLQKVLPWEAMGIDVAATARNGAEALLAVDAVRPDLVLCDIRMPVMDGMAFLREARKRGADCEILMLTGYQEFEYARTALQYGVKDYILKPIDYEQLERSVREAADGIRSRRREQLDRLEKDRQWDRVARLAYEKVLYDVLMGFPPEGAHRLLADEETWGDDTRYHVLLVDVDQYSRVSVHWNERERKLWNFAVGNVLQEALAAYDVSYVSLHAREGEWCIVVPWKPGASPACEDRVRVWLKTLQTAVADNVKLSVSAGAYPLAVPLGALSETYKKLQRSFLRHAGSNRLLVVAEEPAARNGDDDSPHVSAEASWWALVEGIVTGLRGQDRAAIEAALGGLQQAIVGETDRGLVKAEHFLHYVVIHLLRELREMDVVSPAEEAAVWKKLQHSVGLKDMMESIAQLIDQATAASSNKKSSELLMLSAKDYIHRRLASDLGVEEVADHLGISCSYFSLLFKTHYGETFVEYVTKQRMEHAKSLLLLTDKSIAKIGAASGYAERRYFTKVFQRYAGMTPSEFREAKGGRGSG